jgi:glycosyltransferase involved in cell wall biosynthesis
VKILIVVHQWFPEAYSGTEQYALAVAREGKRRGDEVTVCSLVPWFHARDPEVWVYAEEFEEIPVFRIRHWEGLSPNALLRDYRNPVVAAAFRRILRTVRPDAVHFFHLRNLGADLLHVAVDSKVRTVVHLTDYWFLCPRFTLLRSDGRLCEGPPEGGLGCIPCHRPDLSPGFFDPDVREAVRAYAGYAGFQVGRGDRAAEVMALVRRPGYLREALDRVDAVIAPSEFLRSMFARNGYPVERMRVVPYGLAPGLIGRRHVAPRRGPLRVGFIGVLSPWKAPHIAVEAVRAVEGDLVLSVYGRLTDEPFREYIEGMRATAAADPRIRFEGHFDRSRLGQVLGDLDLLLVPSVWYENTPLVALEARQAGVPVIASRLGGLSESVREGRDGWLFPPGEIAGLAACLRRCLESPDTLASLAPEPPPSIAENYERLREAYGGIPCSA